MTPNQITALRVLMAFAAVALFGVSPSWPGPSSFVNLAAVGLTAAAIALDAVDGWVARRKKLESPLGAQLDILGDRVIENLFFTYFAVAGLISIWVPVIFFVRGTATDFLRQQAGRTGRTGFGRNSMLETWWGRALVASRASRAAYGTMKCVCFCWLGMQSGLLKYGASFALSLEQWADAFVLCGQILVLATVAFCLVRGLPVLWEGRRYLAPLEPARVASAGAAHR